ncbi:hypothetical protein DFQ27_001216, partial [Actinomortierella ambigua]
DFLKQGFAISKNLLSIGAATLQEGTNNSTTSQEDGAQNHDAVASKSATGKEKHHPDNNVNKELDAGRSAMPIGTRKRRRSSVNDLLDEGVHHSERVKLRKHDRLAPLAAASSLSSKVEVPVAKDEDAIPHKPATQEATSHGRAHNKSLGRLVLHSLDATHALSRRALQLRTQQHPIPPKKPRPVLQGRYPALETDEEDEEIKRILKERQQSTVAP